jgi:hypothetical protein
MAGTDPLAFDVNRPSSIVRMVDFLMFVRNNAGNRMHLEGRIPDSVVLPNRNTNCSVVWPKPIG